MSDNDSDFEFLDTDSDVEIIEALSGSCPCCGYHGELRYIDGDSDVEARSSNKRKRRRSKSPGSQQFMAALRSAIERPKLEPAPVQLPEPVVKLEHPSFIQRFFNDYPEFEYDPSGETMSQFQHMSQSFNWKRGDPALEAAQQKLRIALTEDFNRIYGRDFNDLRSWQSLCRVLRYSDIPDDLSRCRQVVKDTFVNLVDLVDSRHTNNPVQRFETEEQLRKYSKRTGKIFPREEARAGGLLKFLLRRILSAKPSRNRNGPRPHKRPRKAL